MTRIGKSWSGTLSPVTSTICPRSRVIPRRISGCGGEWLVYGTALGVGDAVVRALRVLEIDLPEARYMRARPIYFYPFVVASTRRVSSSGGRVSGSFGGGGVR